MHTPTFTRLALAIGLLSLCACNTRGPAAPPGHRVHMLATDVTHVGIGVVLGPIDPEFPQAPRAVYCTQNLFKKPGADAPTAEQLTPTLARRVDDQRKRGGLDGGQWDPGLNAAAMQVAERLRQDGRSKPTGGRPCSISGTGASRPWR